MIDTTVVGILHREHPAQVEVELIEDICRMVAALGDVYVETVEIGLVLLVGAEHDSHGKGGVDDVFVEVAGIIPTVW